MIPYPLESVCSLMRNAETVRGSALCNFWALKCLHDNMLCNCYFGLKPVVHRHHNIWKSRKPSRRSPCETLTVSHSYQTTFVRLTTTMVTQLDTVKLYCRYPWKSFLRELPDTAYCARMLQTFISVAQTSASSPVEHFVPGKFSVARRDYIFLPTAS